MRLLFVRNVFPILIFLSIIPCASAGNITYSYDDAGRLIKADYGQGKTIEYTYDAAGNVTSIVSVACEGDFDIDGDVDGSDLAAFAAGLGRTDCAGDCEGDFEPDGDVDGSHLAVFAADFGRTDCP